MNMKTVKAFAITTARGSLVDRYAIFDKVNRAKQQCKKWNDMRGDPTLKVVPCTIIYEVPQGDSVEGV